MGEKNSRTKPPGAFQPNWEDIKDRVQVQEAGEGPGESQSRGWHLPPSITGRETGQDSASFQWYCRLAAKLELGFGSCCYSEHPGDKISVGL